MTRKRESISNEYPMRTTTIATVTIVVLALLIVAMSRTVGTEATGNTGVWIERWNETMRR